MSNITPFVKRMRTVGGTIYVFSSATEDIGLNISERNNIVKMSNYALLNIPNIGNPSSPIINKFNVLAIPGAFNSFISGGANIKDGGVLLAESFQNYALNLEANLINRSEYDPKLPTTVCERVFWKWLKETGAIRWNRSSVDGRWEEDLDSYSSENSVVQNIGEITAGAIRHDGYGSFNETYVMIPSSYGKSKIYFKQIEDTNYRHGLTVTGGSNILGRENYTKPHPDALDYKAYYDLTSSDSIIGSYALTCDGSSGWWTTKEGISFVANSYCTDTNAYMLDTSIALNNTLKYNGTYPIEFNRSKVDCMSLEFNTSVYGKTSFDEIAIDEANGNDYKFNAILIYYSVYPSANAVSPVSTNLLGVLFLDNAVGNTSSININPDIYIPTTRKIQSGPTGFGTSYSFRLNIKTDNMFDDTESIIYDENTSTPTLENFQGVLIALEQSVNTLNKQTSTINYISNQYVDVIKNQDNLVNKLDDLQYSINISSSTNLTGTVNTIPMKLGINLWGDSSVYMNLGNVGIRNNKPEHPLDVSGNIRGNDFILKGNIKDNNGNIILGAGFNTFVKESSLGSSFVWSNGMLTVPAADVSTAIINSHLDALDASVISLRSYSYDVSLNKASITYVNNKFIASLKEASLGSTFKWFNGKVDVCTGPSIDTANFVAYSVYTPEMLTKANLSGNTIFTGDPGRSTDISIDDNSNKFATTKFIKAYIDSSTTVKADKIYVDASLDLKANVLDVSTSLGLKANITYTDASLLLRDSSINKLFSISNDVSIRSYSPYLDTSTVSCLADTSTYIYIGNMYNDRSIIITYTATRDAYCREGEIRILNSNGSCFLTNRYQESGGDPSSNLIGAVFSTLTLNPSINLVLKSDLSSASPTSFKFFKKIISA